MKLYRYLELNKKAKTFARNFIKNEIIDIRFDWLSQIKNEEEKKKYRDTIYNISEPDILNYITAQNYLFTKKGYIGN